LPHHHPFSLKRNRIPHIGSPVPPSRNPEPLNAKAISATGKAIPKHDIQIPANSNFDPG